MTDWQTKKLGEIGTFSKGAGIPKDSAQSGDLPAVRYGELYTSFDVFVRAAKSFINPEVAGTATKISKGDVLFAGSGETIDEIGKSAVYTLDRDGYAGGDIVILRPHDDEDAFFLAYALNSEMARKELRKLGQGQSVVHIYRKDLENLQLMLPEKPEQERIVGVLEVWDEYIEKLEQKIALKEQLKKGLMQQLLTGKRRLPGFSGEWERITLGEVGKVSMCKRIFNKDTFAKGDIPFYKISTFGKNADAYISRELYEEYKQKYSFPSVGDILISASGTIGRTVVYDGRPGYFQDSNIIWIANDQKKMLNSFLYYMYKYVKWDTASGTIARLYNDNVRRVKLMRPSLAEQDRIAEILNTLDDDTALLGKKRRQLLEQKKYLLTNLITGTIRTPENLQPKGAN